jgi:mannitol operon repressor
MKVPSREVVDLSSFLKEFQGETDRGAALVGAAVLDEKLRETLQSFMISTKAAEKLLSGGTAPLGTFSARLDASYALGLINDFEHSECHLIRKVRNEFAHRIHGTTFNDEKISKVCDKLKSDLPGGKAKFKGDFRYMYINAVIMMAVRFMHRAAWVVRERRTTKSWMT